MGLECVLSSSKEIARVLYNKTDVWSPKSLSSLKDGLSIKCFVELFLLYHISRMSCSDKRNGSRVLGYGDFLQLSETFDAIIPNTPTQISSSEERHYKFWQYPSQLYDRHCEN
jgi:hypothetical protein